MTETQEFRLHALITGMVQGVGYRFFVLKSAEELGLAGWVRNRWDGRVEVAAEGPHEALNKLLLKLRRGPIGAQVDDVQYEFSDSKGEFKQFAVLATF